MSNFLRKLLPCARYVPLIKIIQLLFISLFFSFHDHPCFDACMPLLVGKKESLSSSLFFQPYLVLCISKRHLELVNWQLTGQS